MSRTIYDCTNIQELRGRLHECHTSERMKRAQALVNQFKSRWSREYLLELRVYQRSNNKQPEYEVKVGDVILIYEEKQSRNK